MMFKRLIALGFVGISFLVSCQMDSLPEARETYLDLPEVPFDYPFSSNDALPTLGRVLFYDKQLSVNNSVACASCHKQAFAFSDNARFSRGFENRITTRNSMPIQNIGTPFFGFFGDPIFFSQALFWDGREHDLENLVLRPIVNHVEMGITDLDQLTEKLQQVPYYKALFTDAYGTDEINPYKIGVAVGGFMRNITSRNTKMDKAMMGSSSLTPIEQRGLALFFEKYDCNSCHQVQDPNGYIAAGTFSNIGLDPVYVDNGLALVSKNANDNGNFKIPSLRNVALTAPYMHDGRFGTLSEVIDHYSTGIANHPSLDHRLRGGNGEPMRMNITNSEKEALIAFLNTMTDHTMITDPKFSSPFKAK
jgi:cytochrome c peroxidase